MAEQLGLLSPHHLSHIMQKAANNICAGPLSHAVHSTLDTQSDFSSAFVSFSPSLATSLPVSFHYLRVSLTIFKIK